EEIPVDVIAESIALVRRQQENLRAELTSLELAFFEDTEAEHSNAVPTSEEQAEPVKPVERAELLVAVPESGVEVAAVVPDLM
ncbi:PREDICTED: LOC109946780, partial [Prunus dulcis]